MTTQTELEAKTWQSSPSRFKNNEEYPMFKHLLAGSACGYIGIVLIPAVAVCRRDHSCRRLKRL